MSRRTFLQHLAVLASGLTLPATAKALPSASKTLQTSSLAGFQYHHGEMLWSQLAIGQPLQLVREPGNAHDPRAVRIDWQGFKLGYIPRLDNAAVAQLLDRGESLEAVIVALNKSSNPWDRIKVEVQWRM